MTAINFPASPNNGDTFVNGDVTYTWDGVKWTAKGNDPGHVLKAGDTMTGNLTVPNLVSTGNVQAASINGLAYPTAGPLSNRNLIINGAMQVWQRGTTQTTHADYCADRFWMTSASSAARSTDAPAGFTYSTKLTYSTLNMVLGQPIELPAAGEQGQLVAGTTVTLTYYAKVDSGTEEISTRIRFRDSKFVSANEVAFTSSNADATWTTTWTRYEHQFTVPTVAGTNVLAGLEIFGIGKDAYITGVQLEAGSVATPFEHRPIGTELALCQRYYYNHTTSIRTSSYGTSSFNGTWGRQVIAFPVSMRGAPAVTLGALTYGTSPTTARIWSGSVEIIAKGNNATNPPEFANLQADAEL